VKYGFDDINAPTSNIAYCDSSYLTSYGTYDVYTKFSSISQHGVDCTYDGNNLHAIDMYIYDADFGSDLKSEYKKKLDRVNEYYLQHNYHVNSFITNYKKSTYYIGGYPVGSKTNASAE
jgi:hypothetical protein